MVGHLHKKQRKKDEAGKVSSSQLVLPSCTWEWCLNAKTFAGGNMNFPLMLMPSSAAPGTPEETAAGRS